MTDTENQDSLKNFPNKINYIIELPLFIIFITALLYFTGIGYYSSYFTKLSIPTRFINIEQTNYFVMGFFPILILSPFIAIFFKFWSQKPRNRMDALYCNQLVL